MKKYTETTRYDLLRTIICIFIFLCNEFEVSAFVDLISPQGIGGNGSWKYLKCPECIWWSRAAVIRKEET